jgi:hypothetical protein
VAASYEEFKRLEQSCLDDGLLAPAFGRGNLRITKKGAKFVKLASLLDEEVASGVEETLHTPWLERRAALVALLLTARQQLPMNDIERWAVAMRRGEELCERQDDRAFIVAAFLNKTRLDVFSHLVEVAGQGGVNTEDDSFLQSLARFINSATGQGTERELADARRELADRTGLDEEDLDGAFSRIATDVAAEVAAKAG